MAGGQERPCRSTCALVAQDQRLCRSIGLRARRARAQVSDAREQKRGRRVSSAHTHVPCLLAHTTALDYDTHELAAVHLRQDERRQPPAGALPTSPAPLA